LDISPLTLNRLGVYRRALRELERAEVPRVSSQELADRFHLSAAQIRKDLAHFGELGIRGVGYEVPKLTRRLSEILGLDRKHRMVVVGMGNLGSALASYLGFNTGSFYVVGAVDNDPTKVGRKIGDFTVHSTEELAQVVQETGAEVGVLTVPAEAAQENYDLLVQAGVKGVLNFAPVRIEAVPEVPLKQVDLRSQLEELAFFLTQK
jgi:redox-sensing transcriptional repressor